MTGLNRGLKGLKGPEEGNGSTRTRASDVVSGLIGKVSPFGASSGSSSV